MLPPSDGVPLWHGRRRRLTGLLAAHSDVQAQAESSVLQVVMNTLGDMLNDTAYAAIGDDSFLFTNASSSASSTPMPTSAPSTDDPYLLHVFANQTITKEAFGAQTWKVVVIVIGVLLAVLTTLGNLMVMVSFKIDKQLQNISNYFLFSLAVADITIGCISIPLMTYYMATGSWNIGYTMCQFWLCVDYLMSNASVLNLLLISFDRYFSVTRPLTYRPRRTTHKALTAIAGTYIISVILWPPWIISWPYIEGRFTMEEGTCVVQFLETNTYITVGTAIAAFYLPVTIMIILYWRVYGETQRRQREFGHLQAGQMRNRSPSTGAASPESGLGTSGSIKKKQLLPFMDNVLKSRVDKKERRFAWLRACTGKSEYSSEDSSDIKDNVDDTSLGSSVYATASKRSLKGTNSAQSAAECPLDTTVTSAEIVSPRMTALTGPVNGNVANNGGNGCAAAGAKFRSRNTNNVSDKQMHTYTVVIELQDGGKRPSVRLSSCGSEKLKQSGLPGAIARKRSRSDLPTDSIPVVSEAKRVSLVASGHETVLSAVGSTRSYVSNAERANAVLAQPNGKGKAIEKTDHRKSEKEKRKMERKQDSKAAKTLSAILIAFIATWTPYNMIVCWNAFFPNSIPDILFTFSYCLCYVNSTINPLCYALCNARFRLTYLRILRCAWIGNRDNAGGMNARGASGLHRNAYIRRA